MKARMPIEVSKKDYERIKRDTENNIKRYTDALTDLYLGSMIMLLHSFYGFGQKRGQKLIDSHNTYIKHLLDVARTEDPNADELQVMERAASDLKYVLGLLNIEIDGENKK